MIGSKGITTFNDFKVSHIVIKPCIMDDLILQKNKLNQLIRQTNSIISHHDSENEELTLSINKEKGQNEKPSDIIELPKQSKELTLNSNVNQQQNPAKKHSLLTLNLSPIKQEYQQHQKPKVKGTFWKVNLPKYNKHALEEFLARPQQNDKEQSKRSKIPDLRLEILRTSLSENSSFIMDTQKSKQNTEETQMTQKPHPQQTKIKVEKYEDLNFERAYHINCKLRNQPQPNSGIDTLKECLKPNFLPLKNRMIKSLSNSNRKKSDYSEISTTEASRHFLKNSGGFPQLSKFMDAEVNDNKSLADYIKLLGHSYSQQKDKVAQSDQLQAKLMSYAVTQQVLSKQMDESKLREILNKGRKFDSFLKKGKEDSICKTRLKPKTKTKTKSGDCTSLVQTLIKTRKTLKI